MPTQRGATTPKSQTPPPHQMSTTRQELSEDEILSRYGALLWEAIGNFAVDPHYFTEMSRQAGFSDERKARGAALAVRWQAAKAAREASE